ncbi:hypothetical protein [Streptomyces griseorubiginosus]
MELQYGHLSRVDIELRERVYGTMVWLFDACNSPPKRSPAPGHQRPGENTCDSPGAGAETSTPAAARSTSTSSGSHKQADGLHLILRINRCHPKQPGRLSGSGDLYAAEAFHNWMQGTACP